MKSFKLLIASAKSADLIIIIFVKNIFCPPKLAQSFLEFSLNQGQDFVFKESSIQGVTNVPAFKYKTELYTNLVENLKVTDLSLQ